MPHQRTRQHRLLLLLTFSWLILAVSARNAGGVGHTPGKLEEDSLANDADVVDANDNNPSSTSDSGSGPGSGSGSGSPVAGTGTSGTEDGARAGGAFWPGGGSYNNPGAGGGGFPGDWNRDRDRTGFDVEQALNYRRVHGILAALAFVVLFPVGSVLLRLVPGRVAVWVHVCVQMVAWGVYVAAAGLGVYLVRVVRVPGDGLLQTPSTRYHPIIGLVLLALLVIQPVVGFVHHRAYKRVQERQLWSYLHLVIGRVGITLGIVNGGLGLYISNASAYHTRVYSIVAAVIWALWMVVAVWAEVRKLRQSRHGTYTAVSKPRAGGGRTSLE